MNLAVLAKSARNVLSTIEIKFNRLAGREFVPIDEFLNIETSSACNLKCRFCAYEKKQTAKISVKDAVFADRIGQALNIGYRKFDLTPCTGDVFMDRHIFNKLEFLDEHPDVTGYRFFTNFTVPDPEDIERLVGLKKLVNLAISVYGHDAETFVAITKSKEKIYRRLVANLEALYGLRDRINFSYEFGLRSTNDMPRNADSEVLALLERFKQHGIAVRPSSVYNNWGGYISQDDMAGLAIDITGAEDTYKDGVCVRLLTQPSVLADGTVNGCACRDVDATLALGNLADQPLHAILSADNPVYMNLIEEQQQGIFRPICRSCDYYKSVYHNRSTYRKEGVPLQSLERFKQSISGRGAAPKELKSF